MSIENILELEAEHYVNRVYGEDSDSTEKIKLAYIAGAKRRDLKPTILGSIVLSIITLGVVCLTFLFIVSTKVLTTGDLIAVIILATASITFAIMTRIEIFNYRINHKLY